MCHSAPCRSSMRKSWMMLTLSHPGFTIWPFNKESPKTKLKGGFPNNRPAQTLKGMWSFYVFLMFGNFTGDFKTINLSSARRLARSALWTSQRVSSTPKLLRAWCFWSKHFTLCKSFCSVCFPNMWFLFMNFVPLLGPRLRIPTIRHAWWISWPPLLLTCQ